jgi:hypothetical protein
MLHAVFGPYRDRVAVWRLVGSGGSSIKSKCPEDALTRRLITPLAEFGKSIRLKSLSACLCRLLPNRLPRDRLLK